MTDESKFRHETVTHCNSGAAEFLRSPKNLVSTWALWLIRTELSFAMARRKCGRIRRSIGCMLAAKSPTLPDQPR
jgi:hypothetical protein